MLANQMKYLQGWVVDNRRWLIGLFMLAFAFGLPRSAVAGSIDFSDCGNGSPCPYMTYGNANSYSLALNALLWDNYQGGGTGPGNPFYVSSSPGAIKDLIVPATGASGTQVNTNFSGMDNAYHTPNDQGGTVFFTTNKTAYGYPTTGYSGSGVSAPADPGQVAPFAGDSADTWDTTLNALQAALGTGNTPIFFFNNNQTNSGSAADQDLAVWAQITLTGGGNTPLYFDLTNDGAAYGAGGTLNGDATSYSNTTGTGPTAGTNDATDYVKSGGQICLDSSFTQVACSGPHAYTVNNNLGANQAAYAIVVPGLNSILGMPNFGGYTTLSLDLRLGCDPNTTGFNTDSTGNCLARSINNGYEQVFIASYNEVTHTVPEPGALFLMGTGLVALGMVCRRRPRKASL